MMTTLNKFYLLDGSTGAPPSATTSTTSMSNDIVVLVTLSSLLSPQAQLTRTAASYLTVKY